MMGRQDRDQRQLFYEFSLDEMIPADHLLRRINVFATAVLADLHEQLKAFYSDIGRPSVDPELMIRMLLVGYCYGIRHERRPLEASNIDGDTLEIHGTRVRLWGADAPESSQLCGGEDRLAYRCGCSRIAVPGVPTAIRAEMTA